MSALPPCSRPGPRRVIAEAIDGYLRHEGGQPSVTVRGQNLDTPSQSAMIVPPIPRPLVSRSAAARVSFVGCPLTCNTRANARTRSDRSAMERPRTAPMPESSKAAATELSGSGCDIRFHHLAGIDNVIKFDCCTHNFFLFSLLAVELFAFDPGFVVCE